MTREQFAREVQDVAYQVTKSYKAANGSISDRSIDEIGDWLKANKPDLYERYLRAREFLSRKTAA